ncbi:MAG: Exodeoxyribonuclease 7 large subunit [uncultured bacterium]|nr:MAG: Exodeoxyribonuclease 7 large subunit [uncultured bacterium]
MDNLLLQKLKHWRKTVAQRDGVELFRILPNKVLEDIARLKPICKEDLLAIKGIKEKKFEKYGFDILLITQGCAEGMMLSDKKESTEEKVYTVSAYLDILNRKLSQETAIIQGEVSSISLRNGHAYFAIKDKNDESLLNCFMWASKYEMSGVELAEGMEVIIHGLPEVYKPYGKLSLGTTVIELVGEGALKKAYDALKNKLEAEGLFLEERKKSIPQFPHKIGLITSRDGAVIGDFSANIGKFGYEIIFMDSRVEGAAAIGDLIDAVDYFSDKDIDALVIIRGGGSLESLQAFNNEMLVRRVVGLNVPVICGIGHDKDIPLLSYVADMSVSTPTAVAQVLNKSWEKALDRLEGYEKSIIKQYEAMLKDGWYKLESASSRIRDFYQEIFKRFEFCDQSIRGIVSNFTYILQHNHEKLKRTSLEIDNFYQGIFKKFNECQQTIKNNIISIAHSIRHEKYKIQKIGNLLLAGFGSALVRTKKELYGYEKEINQNNPERQLKLGYSIATLNGKVIRSASQVRLGEILTNKLGDGEIKSEVQEIFNN